MKSNKVFLLIAVAMALFCILSSGCTSTTTEEVKADNTVQDQQSSPENMPTSGNMTAPDGAAGGPAGQGGMDLTAAAAALGITEEQLSEALGSGEDGPADLESAAAALGITLEELQEALGMTGDMPEGGSMPEGGMPGGDKPEGTMPSEPPA